MPIIASRDCPISEVLRLTADRIQYCGGFQISYHPILESCSRICHSRRIGTIRFFRGDGHGFTVRKSRSSGEEYLEVRFVQEA